MLLLSSGLRGLPLRFPSLDPLRCPVSHRSLLQHDTGFDVVVEGFHARKSMLVLAAGSRAQVRFHCDSPFEAVWYFDVLLTIRHGRQCDF